MKRSRLRKVSKKRAQELKVYHALRSKFLERHPVCQIGRGLIGCTNLSNDVHHRKGRVGKQLLDRRSWIAVCRPCHARLHDHPKEARKMGWIKT